jgi:hypothetical protein
MSARLTTAQRRAVQQRRTAMKATARRENPLLGDIVRGARAGYHLSRAKRYESKAATHRRRAVLNPGRIPGTALEIRYRRSGSQPGLYKHPFEHPVRMYANGDGSVTLRGAKRIHADDRERDFDQYVHPSHGRRNPMARRSGGGRNMWLWIGLGALLILKPGILGGIATAGGGSTTYAPGTVWLDTTDGTMVVGPSLPGPNWRLATQAEIQMAVIPA